MKTLSEAVKVYRLIDPQVAVATVTGVGVDVESGETDAMAILNIGACLTTDETCIVTIEGSATLNGSYSNLATFGTLTGTSDSKIAAVAVAVGGANSKFVRAKATIAGTTPSFAIGVTLQVQQSVDQVGNTSATAA